MTNSNHYCTDDTRFFFLARKKKERARADENESPLALSHPVFKPSRILISFSGCVAFHSIRPSRAVRDALNEARICISHEYIARSLRAASAARARARTVIGVLLQWERRFCWCDSLDRSTRIHSRCSVLIRPVLKAPARSPRRKTT